MFTLTAEVTCRAAQAARLSMCDAEARRLCPLNIQTTTSRTPTAGFETRAGTYTSLGAEETPLTCEEGGEIPELLRED